MTKQEMWNNKVATIWYNDEEIFNFSDADFDKKAKDYADTGITIVMTFSCTHFRWNFILWFDKINECLAKLTTACHKYGIKVIEHHSSHLTFDPLNKDDLDFAKIVLEKRQSSLNSWLGMEENISKDSSIDGHDLSSFRQVDGSTGKWTRTPYHGYGMCFNNPDYRIAYFSYLEELYKTTKVDGIMTDDVQYFGQGCTCEHCRKLFHEQTGYELPQSENWQEFFGDYSNPLFIAFLKFRLDSTRSFQEAVSKHYRMLGLEMLRLNYVSSSLCNNSSAYPFEEAREQWDYVMQENPFSMLLAASTPSFADEAVHRYAMAQRKHTPSISMFYPDRPDSAYYTWALANTWGQLSMLTSEGEDILNILEKYYHFEQEHAGALQAPRKLSELAFLHPLSSFNFTQDSLNKVKIPMCGTMQAARFSNLQADMIFEYDSLAEWQRFPLIVCAGALMMSDALLEQAVDYVKSGGRLLFLGDFASFDVDGSARHAEEVSSFFDFKCSIVGGEPAGLEYDGKKVELNKVAGRCFRNIENAEVFCSDSEDRAIGITAKLGEGSVFWMVDGIDLSLIHSYAFLRRFAKTMFPLKAQDYVGDILRNRQGAVMRALLPNSPVIELDAEEGSDYRVSAFARFDGKGYSIHLLNMTGVIKKRREPLSHDDLIENFTVNAPKNASPLKIVFRPEAELPVNATLFTPEKDGSLDLQITRSDDYITLEVPVASFAGYALIEAQK